METLVKVEILAREIIKPSSPTPLHLREFKLSLLDQLAPSNYESMLFFYAGNNEDIVKISSRLKSSLSKTLTNFYPFAGKIKNKFSIECNDDGVEYVEGRASGLLSEFLQKPPDHKLLREFLPIELESPKASTGPILLVQATFFNCGGLIIGFSATHRLIDAHTLLTFIRSWAAATREEVLLPPKYVTASMFPASESFVPFPKDHSQHGCVTKRFVFDATKLAALKTKVTSASVPIPSRIEAVTALIWKCARSNRSGFPIPRPSLLVNAVNLRNMMVPPLPYNSVGNVIGYFSAQMSSKKEIQLHELVSILRKGKEEFSKNGIQALLETKYLCGLPKLTRDKIEREEIDFYFFSSLSKLPLYEVDFGWGKPIWVTLPSYTISNFVIMLDTKDGKGIEAIVTLGAEDMALFERDNELLAFANCQELCCDVGHKSAKRIFSHL